MREHFQDKRVLVAGLGASGYAAARLLGNMGARLLITDSDDNEALRRRAQDLRKFKPEVELGAHSERFCSKAELVVASPGLDSGALPLRTARKKNIPVTGELELGYRACRSPVVAVTGTNGKSTAARLTGHILHQSGRKAVVCGNIGTPLSQVVSDLGPEDTAVVEVSSFQLETVDRFKPHVAMLLNISQDHYDRHLTPQRYIEEKFKIFNRQDEKDWALIHSSVDAPGKIAGLNSRLVVYGDRTSGHVRRDRDRIGICIRGRSVTLEREMVPLAGEHNIDNMICCVLACMIMGAPGEGIIKGISTFRGLDHRFQVIGSFRGVTFINDSKATNIDATAKALSSVEGRVVLIAGGRDKGGDYASIRPLVRDKVKAMVLIGEAAGVIKRAFQNDIRILTAESMEQAVKKAAEEADRGEKVLLSPMCSSFDMYENYKLRGKDFCNSVTELFNIRTIPE